MVRRGSSRLTRHSLILAAARLEIARRMKSCPVHLSVVCRATVSRAAGSTRPQEHQILPAFENAVVGQVALRIGSAMTSCGESAPPFAGERQYRADEHPDSVETSHPERGHE